MEKLTEEQARELLNEYHDNTGSCVCREAIDTFIAKKFPKLELGKWYKTDGWDGEKGACKALVFVESVQEYTFTGYGWNAQGWNDRCGGWATDGFTEQASDKEVEEALIAEAKRREYKEGVTIMPAHVPSETTKIHRQDGFYFDGHYLYSYFDSLRVCLNDELNRVVFYNGKWAEIISEPDKEEMTLDQIEKELGRKIKIVSLPDKE